MSITAPTYDPTDAYNVITPQLSNVTLNATAKGHIANIAHLTLWNVYPWRWTRKILPDITLVDIQQDYTGTAVPSDFHQLIQASVVRTDTTPDTIYELDIKTWLAQDAVSSGAIPRWIAFLHELNSAAGGFRFLPVPGVSSGLTWVARGIYKKTPTTTYTSANLTTNFVELPDMYFPAYCEILLWHAYRYVGDARAGAASAGNRGRRSYSGQLAVAADAVEQMLQAEDMGDVDTLFPDEPLGFFRPLARNLFP